MKVKKHLARHLFVKYFTTDKPIPKSFVKTKKSDEGNEVSIHFDYSKHTLLSHLYMFKYGNIGVSYVLHDVNTSSLIGIDLGDFQASKNIINKLEYNLKSELRHLFLSSGSPLFQEVASGWKKERSATLSIYSGSSGQIEKGDFCEVADKQMNDIETMSVGDICIACFHTPGISKSQVSYVFTHVTKDSTKIPLLFSGDTLHHGGIGKIINGSYEEIYASLSKILYLPNDTLIFPNKDNTLSNIQFNLKLDPNNQFAKDKLDWALKIKQQNNFAVGGRLIEERLYNCFLKVKEPYYQKLTGQSNPVKCLESLRLIFDELQKQQLKI